MVSSQRRLPGPYLLMGDLNLPPPLPKLFAGWQCLAKGPTFPAPNPHLQLDHVLASPGLDLHVERCEARELAVSDHRAVVVDVT